MLHLLAPLLALAPLPLTQPFVDRTQALNLDLAAEHVAWGDVNADGWPDLYCRGKLYINNAGKGFTRVDIPGAGEGSIADIDNDGRGDLVCFSPIGVFRNTGDGPDGRPMFEALALPTLPETVSRGAAIGDFNGDGFLDVYIAGFENWEKQITYPSFLLISQQGRGFALAMTFADFRARGVTACDFDEDADLDIYVSNYRLQPNVLWLNDSHAVMTNQAAKCGVIATSPGFGGGHSIGACWGDFDADGHTDLFAGNFAHVDSRGDQPKSRFLRNLGPDKGWTFQDMGTSGVQYQESYASPACADFDNDSRLDLYFTTVYPIASFGRPNFPVLFHNEIAAGAPDWKFADVTAGSGLEKLPATYQAAWADFDADGDLDLVTAGKLFVNTRTNADSPTPEGAHWLELRLIGDAEQCNHDAIGAQARIKLEDGRVLSRQVECGTGEGNANSPILHFGLGSATGPFDVEVRWPISDADSKSAARTQLIKGVPADRLTVIHATSTSTKTK